MVIQINVSNITNEVGGVSDILAVEKSAKVIALNSNKAQVEELALAA